MEPIYMQGHFWDGLVDKLVMDIGPLPPNLQVDLTLKLVGATHFYFVELDEMLTHFGQSNKQEGVENVGTTSKSNDNPVLRPAVVKKRKLKRL